MPKDGDFKKIVRQRMVKTGESYSAAGSKLVGPQTASKSGMYPFDRFDHGAKEALRIAQVEAEKEQAGLILPQHILIGLLRQGRSRTVLRTLGVRAPAVRAALNRRGQRRVHHPAGRIIPAAETKRVIDQALHEAQQRGSQQVTTEHLLLAIFNETDDPACRVLAELGATPDRAAALMAASQPGRRDRTARAPAPQPQPSPVATSGLAAAMQRGRNAAQTEGAMFFRSDHMLGQLVARDSQTPALIALLQAVGADVDQLRRRLRPPRRVTRLESEIWRLRLQQDSAVRDGDDDLARRLLDTERGLRDQLAAALDAWNASWSKPIENHAR